MISKVELKEIRNYLELSQSPLFLFDDDNDGLCSFLLLRKFIQRGNGLQIKTNPEITESSLNLVTNHNPDYIFILDKPLVSQEFIDEAKIPIIWIDHHPPVKRRKVKYFNPMLKSNKETSTTYWCYKTVDGSLWIAVIGALSDYTIPDYFKEFRKKYPDLVSNKKTPQDLLYNSQLGKLCKIFSLINKAKHDVFKRCAHMLLKIDNPYEILNATTDAGKFITNIAAKINKKYDDLLAVALKSKKEKNLLIFSYLGQKTSFTSDLSNELIYRNPRSFVIVAREKEEKIIMSLRSDIFNVRKILEKALSKIPGYGGGHKHACGASISKDDFNNFLNIIKKEINK